MGFRNLQETVSTLEQTGQLRHIEVEVDPYLEVGAIQRRVYAAGGPALFFSKVKGCGFPMLGNLFGTLERGRYLFRDTLPAIEKIETTFRHDISCLTLLYRINCRFLSTSFVVFCTITFQVQL